MITENKQVGYCHHTEQSKEFVFFLSSWPSAWLCGYGRPMEMFESKI